MYKNIFNIIILCILFFYAKGVFGEKERILKNVDKVLIEEILNFLNKDNTSTVDQELLMNFLVQLSKDEFFLPDSVQWHGKQFSTKLIDIDNDKDLDIAISHFESDSKGSVYVFFYDKVIWKLYEKHILSFEFDNILRKSEVIVMDINDDGIKDIIIRFIGGAQRVQSLDCFVVSFPNDIAPYKSCFIQKSALWDDYIRSGSEFFNISYLSDLNGDLKYELVVTSFYISDENDEKACWLIWPDVFKWDNNKYSKSNGEFPEFFHEYRTLIPKNIDVTNCMDTYAEASARIANILK